MPWVRFTADYDYHVPGKPVVIAYKAGMKLLVTTPCSEAAIAKGIAEPARKSDATSCNVGGS